MALDSLPSPEPGTPAQAGSPVVPVFAPLSPPSSPPPPVLAPARRTDRSFWALLVFGLLIAVGGISFAVGRGTAPAPAAVTDRGNFAGPGGFPGAGTNVTGGAGAAFASGGILLRGTIETASPTSLTLKEANGTSLTINLSGTTTYHAQAAASAADLTVGATVQVQVSGDLGGARAGLPGGSLPGASPGLGALPSPLASGAPGAGGAPLASGAPLTGGTPVTRVLSASDVTIVSP